VMKKLCLLLVLVVGLAACGGDGSDDPAGSSGTSGITELSLNQRTSGSIAQIGEVDWYHFNAVETNNVLQIQCRGDSPNPPLEFLAQVYVKDDQGNYVRIWGSHAPENAALAANIVMNIPIDQPKDLYISVRDLLDDEASAQTHYYLDLAYTHEAVENETFAQAIALGVDNPNTCATDLINVVGDVDCFKFNITTDGVYAVTTDFNFYGSTPVRLDLKLGSRPPITFGIYTWKSAATTSL
jgi:hypothetical protein